MDWPYPDDARVFEANGQWFAVFGNMVVPVTTFLDALDVPCSPEESASCIAGTDALGYCRIEFADDSTPATLQ